MIIQKDSILITPITGLEKCKELHRTHVISINSYGDVARLTPAGIAKENHLQLFFDDFQHRLSDDEETLALAWDMQPPKLEHVEKLLQFVRSLPDDAKLLIHCFIGYSRSPAAAFILVCDNLGPGKEKEAMQIVQASIYPNEREIAPNINFVALADKHLNRNGKMIEIVASLKG